MLKAAVIGTGLIATQKHVPAWKNVNPLAQLVALCDVDAQRATSVAQQFGIPRAYHDVGEMLEREHPDIVDICTPPRTHAPIAIQCLEGGAHTLIEKPMAVSTDECDAVMAAAEAHGRAICLAHSDLFYPSFMAMREMVRAGTIGEFRGMRIFLSTPVDYITSKSDHWANKLPGGVIGETGPHIVYMTLAFINPIQEIQVYGQKQLPEYPWSPYEDYRLTLAGERTVSNVTLTYSTNQWAATVDVWGSMGMITADLESQAVVHTNRTSLSPQAVGTSTVLAAGQMIGRMAVSGARRIAGRQETTHGLLIRAFCESLVNGTEPPVPAQEGRESIRVMGLIADQLRSAEQN